jgi:hypothetical protein
MTNERFRDAEEFTLRFEERVPSPPTFERLRARAQGQCLFIGAYWMYVHEARALRDWLNKVLPDTEKPSVTEDMVDRFLRWPVPKSVCSDTCVSDNDYKFPRYGTNLLTENEARQMLEYVLSAPETGGEP